MQSELYRKIIDQQGRLENLIRRIPGFKGYHEKNARRQADKILREHLVKQFDALMQRFITIENKILDGGKGLKYMSRTREVKSKFQAYIDRVDTAAPKYSGMFASIKVDEAALDRIYAFDEAQVRYETRLEQALDALNTAVDAEEEDFMDRLEEIYDIAVEANEAFQLRDDVILNLTEYK